MKNLFIVYSILLNFLSIAEGTDFWTNYLQTPETGNKIRKRFKNRHRKQHLKMARVWQSFGPANFNIETGLDQITGKKRFSPSDDIVCYFKSHQHNPDAKTPKFRCLLENGKEIKVKYTDPGVPDSNPEVFTEVFGTRFLWALGFPTDFVYPVNSVTCHNCPKNPFTEMGARATRRFDYAMVEYKFGKKIKLKKFQGIYGREFKRLVGSHVSGEKTNVEMLFLLGGLLGYSDGKPDNQKLVCPKQAIRKDGSCKRPYGVFHDLGMILGTGFTPYPFRPSYIDIDGFERARSTSKGYLRGWRRDKIFYGSKGCKLNFKFKNQPLFGRVRIGKVYYRPGKIREKSRKKLLALLDQLSDQQFIDLIQLSKLDVFAPAEAWLKTYKSKVEEIRHRRCSD